MAVAIVVSSGCAAIRAGAPVPRAPAVIRTAPRPWPTSEPIERVRQALQAGRYRAADSLASAMRLDSAGTTAIDTLALADFLDLASEAAWRSGDRRTRRPVESAALAVSLREAKLGPDHVDVARSLIALGRALDAHRELASAESTLRRALAIREAHLGADDTLTATAHSELARVVEDRGDDAESQRLHERALAIRERSLGPDQPDVAASLDDLADVVCNRGEPTRARRLSERSLAITARCLGIDHPLYARRLATLSWICRASGSFDDAIRAAQQAIDIDARRLGSDHLDLGRSIMGLADSYVWSGHYREGLEQHERALPIFERALAPDDERLAWPVGGLGDLYHLFGDEARARVMLERALALRERYLPPLHPDLALSLDRLGQFYFETGEPELAKPMLERALSIRRRILPRGHVDIATSLSRLATCELELGEGARARTLWEEAAPIFEHAEGPISPLGWGLSIEAELAYADGDLGRAARYFGRALEQLKQNGPGQVGGIEYALGMTCLKLNRLEDARRVLARGARHIAEGCGPDHGYTAFALRALGRAELRLGHGQAAFDLARHAEEIECSELRRNVRELPEQLGLRVAATRRDGLDMMLRIVSAAGARDARRDSLALDALVRSRAVVLDEIAARHHPSLERGDTALARLADRYESACRRLGSLEVRSPGGLDPALYRRLLDDARRERDDAEQALASHSAAFRGERARSAVGLDAVEAAVGKHEAIVSMARYDTDLEWHGQDPARARKGRNGSPGSPAAYVAFVLRRGRHAPSVVPLGDAGSIDRLVAAWRREARAGRARDGRGAEDVYRAVATVLERAVWEPIALHLRGVEHVFVVPDGALQLVNWGTMPVDGGRYLIETGPVVSYLSAERDLVEPPAAAHGSGLLAIGAPDYDADPGGSAMASAGEAALTSLVERFRGPHTPCADFRTARFGPLPAARLELDDVTAAWSGAPAGNRAPSPAARTTPDLGRAMELTGLQATEGAFAEHAPGRRVIHIATHAFFTGAECASKPGDRGIGALVEASGIAPPPGENPLHLSGLVLAGANRRDQAAPGQDDGVLTAEEIAALDLSGVEWAVLSGCDTGLGEQSPGEGVLGLRRAFQVAGVRTLIISLWDVEDRATREWMRKLYAARLDRGLGTSESVRDACLETLRDRRARHESTHPADWGVFVNIGDWR